jgi:cytochrome c556
MRTLLPVLLVGAAAGSAVTAGLVDAQSDSRQPIQVSAMQRDHMLTEMRGFLAAVNGVLRGVATRDTALMRASAASAGMTAMRAQMQGRGMGGMGMGMGMGAGPGAPMSDSAMRARHDSMMARGMAPMGPGGPASDSAMRARHDSMMARGMAPAMNDSARQAHQDSMRSRGMTPGAGMGMGRRMPEAFRQLGMATHLGFDSLATLAANRRTPRDTIVARVARLTDNCVSCHAMYRLEVR